MDGENGATGVATHCVIDTDRIRHLAAITNRFYQLSSPTKLIICFIGKTVMHPSVKRYAPALVALHWLMALMIIAMLFAGPFHYCGYA
ncbi:MAG TPA: hypothetical protein PKI38_04795 [Ottowia sp.]|uniref:hypothetical protein n=1 Tax=Ottowia sp. TaxID=1898956 RepID=UPI002BDF9C63|nr:hypothetical protein [Ottowia sp.]HOB66023.1 hypothetical protein [Ottowia sp.]